MVCSTVPLAACARMCALSNTININAASQRERIILHDNVFVVSAYMHLRFVIAVIVLPSSLAVCMCGFYLIPLFAKEAATKEEPNEIKKSDR